MLDGEGLPDIAQRAPDYVVAVAPNAAGALGATDGAATVLFACRGYARADVTVRTLEPAAADAGGAASAPLVSANVGPVADPILCLAKALGALRRDGDGALAVPGLHAIRRDAYATPRLQVDAYDEARLRDETGLLAACELVHAHAPLAPSGSAGRRQGARRGRDRWAQSGRMRRRAAARSPPHPSRPGSARSRSGSARRCGSTSS